MAFGKTFYTRKEANAYLKKHHEHNTYTMANGFPDGYGVRHLSKKHFPRRKKRFHVGSYIDWVNFA